MTAVVVTGATAPFGRAVVRRLLRDPEVTRVLAVGGPHDGLGSTSTDTVRRYFGSSPQKLTVETFDLTRERDLRNLLFGPVAELGMTVLMHAASHRAARDAGESVHALNVDATRDLLGLSERHPTLARFVYKSFSDVYRIRARQPSVVTEDHPLELSEDAPEWVRDRIEADLTVCARMGLSSLQTAVLRCAECLAPGCGSQLYDYLHSHLCFTPMGFDPMLNVLDLEDLAEACRLAVHSSAQGVFNIPGGDTLPLSEVIYATGRRAIPVPSPLIGPLYGARAATIGADFRYDQNYHRFHFGGVMDGRRARGELGYEPHHRIDWPALDAP